MKLAYVGSEGSPSPRTVTLVDARAVGRRVQLDDDFARRSLTPCT